MKIFLGFTKAAHIHDEKNIVFLDLEIYWHIILPISLMFITFTLKIQCFEAKN